MRASPALLALALAACPSRPEHPAPAAPAAETKPAPTPADELILPAADGGKAAKRPDGSTLHTFGPISLPGAIAKASGPVLLRLEGIKAEPASEAEFYLADPVRGFEPLDYVGSFATIAGGGAPPSTHILEVNDFDVEGKHYTARTTLRAQSSFTLAMVVKQGSVSVERFVLAAEPEGGHAP